MEDLALVYWKDSFGNYTVQLFSNSLKIIVAQVQNVTEIVEKEFHYYLYSGKNLVATFSKKFKITDVTEFGHKD